MRSPTGCATPWTRSAEKSPAGPCRGSTPSTSCWNTAWVAAVSPACASTPRVKRLRSSYWNFPCRFLWHWYRCKGSGMSYQSVFRPGLFAGKTIIVTGGGSGIGRCTAHELAALGAKVALVGRKAEKVEAVKAEILEDDGTASAHVCDIREEESVKATVKAIIAEHGGLNGVVNNAGGQFPSPLANINQKGWETV